MAQGMQIYDNSGDLLIDTSTFIGNVINSITVSTGSGSITNSLLSNGTPFAFCSIPSTGTTPFADGTESTPTWPEITFSGDTMSWTKVDDPNVTTTPFTIFYGVF